MMLLSNTTSATSMYTLLLLKDKYAANIYIYSSNFYEMNYEEIVVELVQSCNLKIGNNRYA